MTLPTAPAPCASAQVEPAIVAEVGLAPDGRQTLTVLRVNSPRNAYNPRRWTRVRNIDGSNDFMPDDGGWEFLPWGDKPYMAAVNKALAAAALRAKPALPLPPRRRPYPTDAYTTRPGSVLRVATLLAVADAMLVSIGSLGADDGDRLFANDAVSAGIVFA